MIVENVIIHCFPYSPQSEGNVTRVIIVVVEVILHPCSIQGTKCVDIVISIKKSPDYFGFRAYK